MSSIRFSYAVAVCSTLALAGWLAPGEGFAAPAQAGRPPTGTGASRSQTAVVRAAAARRAPSGALDARGMWIWYVARSEGGSVAAIADRARSAGVKTLLIKSGDGTNYWSQFSPRLVSALRARGLHVCAWQYVYGTNPIGEALVAKRAVRAGAECFVIDAEVEYEGRYASAQRYMRELRRGVGGRYPIGLAAFPYVDYHPAFPYSVFLGPDGAQFNMPQMYWRDIGTSPAAVFDHTYTVNRIYRRSIRPVGQTYGSPAADDARRFRALAVRYGSPGISWWDFAWTSATGLWPAVGGGFAPAGAARLGWPRLQPGSRGDDVLWLQEHLAAVFPAQRTTGLFGAQTLAAVRAFQAKRRLPATGRTDGATWLALLRLRPPAVQWGAGRASVARATGAAPPGSRGHLGRGPVRAAVAPASASLPARAREIPEFGASLVHADAAHAEP